MKTIFEIVKPAQKEIWFDEWYNDEENRWETAITSTKDYDYCVKIASYSNHDYYVCWNETNATLRETVLYRAVK